MRKLIAAILLAAAAQVASAANIALFGSNAYVENFLKPLGAVTVVDNDYLESANALRGFDLFVYTYNSASIDAPVLTPTAAQTVHSFVTGNIVLFTSDIADTGFDAGSAPAVLMTNAVAFASNKGYIGLLVGACAAMSTAPSNLVALDLVAGNCDDINVGLGGDPQRVQNDSPIVKGLSNPFDLGTGASDFYAKLNNIDPNLIVAYNTINGAQGNPSIISLQRQGQPVDEPATLMLLGFGLVGLSLARRRRAVRTA